MKTLKDYVTDVQMLNGVLTLRLEVPKGFEFTIMHSSDRHHDHVACNRELETAHLEEAKTRDALIIDAGDIFDAMQGKKDKRSSYDELRPEYKGLKYFDLLLTDFYKYYAPYTRNWLLMGTGNHEYSILEHHNWNIIDRLVDRLRKDAGAELLHRGGLSGWIRLLFTMGGHRTSIKIRYSHGGGGTNAPVTRGVIQTNRQAVYLPDADIVHNGHNHQEYSLGIKRIRLSLGGRQYGDIQHYIRTPGYKFKDESGENINWESLKEFAPSPIGVVWSEIKFDSYGKFVIKCTDDIR